MLCCSLSTISKDALPTKLFKFEVLDSLVGKTSTFLCKPSENETAGVGQKFQVLTQNGTFCVFLKKMDPLLLLSNRHCWTKNLAFSESTSFLVKQYCFTNVFSKKDDKKICALQAAVKSAKKHVWFVFWWH